MESETDEEEEEAYRGSTPSSDEREASVPPIPSAAETADEAAPSPSGKVTANSQAAEAKEFRKRKSVSFYEPPVPQSDGAGPSTSGPEPCAATHVKQEAEDKGDGDGDM